MPLLTIECIMEAIYDCLLGGRVGLQGWMFMVHYDRWSRYYVLLLYVYMYICVYVYMGMHIV